MTTTLILHNDTVQWLTTYAGHTLYTDQEPSPEDLAKLYTQAQK